MHVKLGVCMWMCVWLVDQKVDRFCFSQCVRYERNLARTSLSKLISSFFYENAFSSKDICWSIWLRFMCLFLSVFFVLVLSNLFGFMCGYYGLCGGTYYVVRCFFLLLSIGLFFNSRKLFPCGSGQLIGCQYIVSILGGHYFQYDGEVWVFVSCFIVAKVSSNCRTIGLVHGGNFALKVNCLVFSWPLFATFSFSVPWILLFQFVLSSYLFQHPACCHAFQRRIQSDRISNWFIWVDWFNWMPCNYNRSWILPHRKKQQVHNIHGGFIPLRI